MRSRRSKGPRQHKQCRAAPRGPAPTKPQCLMAAKEAATLRIDVAHPKKGPRQRKQRGREETTMSRGRKKNRDDEGLMLRAPKKAATTQNNVAQPQKAAATTHQCLAPQKKTRRQRIDVACPKKGPRQHKTMSHGPKGRTDETPTSRGLKKKAMTTKLERRGSEKGRGNVLRATNHQLARPQNHVVISQKATLNIFLK